MKQPIFTISLIFNLVPSKIHFVCYIILHSLNKTRERAFAKGWQRNTLEARKMSLRRLFSHPQNGTNERENEGYLREKRGKFRNKLTDLSNTKTS